MSLRFAILGLLSTGPKSGYDLKKIMQSSPFMYWSASNNQIYSTLLDLKKEAYVENETLSQEGLPAKKPYSITEQGLKLLKCWVASVPETLEFRKSFLIQLAWSEQLDNGELDKLLLSYESVLSLRLAMEKNLISDGLYCPARSDREKAIWKFIYESGVSSYENELAWLSKLREELKNTDCSGYEHINEADDEKGGINVFKYNIRQSFIEILPGGKQVESERDSLELISLCAENGKNTVLIHNEALSDEFVRLATGVAGSVLQKFTNYNIRLAIVVDKNRMSKRFEELAGELNDGKFFGVFESAEKAAEWIEK